MSWRDPGSYGLPVAVAILIHIVAVGLLLAEWQRDSQTMPEPLPPQMTAKVIQQENRAVKAREEQRRLDLERAQRLAREKAAREKAAKEKAAREKAAKEKAAKEKAAKEKAEAQKAAEEKAAKEKAAKEKAAKEKAAKEKAAAQKAAEEKAAKEKAAAQKAAEEKAAKEKAAKEKAAKEKAAKEKAAKEQAAREEAARVAAEQAMMEQLALEQAEAEIRQQEAAARAAAEAERAAVLTSEYQDLIRAQVASVWSYPPNVTRDLEVEVRLVMVPTGEVISATVTRSSGHEALDRSVERAIMKASPLPVPDDIRVFEKNFRTLTMKVRPENASW